MTTRGHGPQLLGAVSEFRSPSKQAELGSWQSKPLSPHSSSSSTQSHSQPAQSGPSDGRLGWAWLLTNGVGVRLTAATGSSVVSHTFSKQVNISEGIHKTALVRDYPVAICWRPSRHIYRYIHRLPLTVTDIPGALLDIVFCKHAKTGRVALGRNSIEASVM